MSVFKRSQRKYVKKAYRVRTGASMGRVYVTVGA
jgi:hypothetical protein